MNPNRNIICILLTIIPLIALIYCTNKYIVDVPYLDQWDLIPTLDKLYNHSLSSADLWAQHNEHRPLFPRIIMLTLAHISKWRISYELAASILIASGMFLTLIHQLKKTTQNLNFNKPYWIIPVISVITFSLAQCENWLWGWQIQIHLNILTVVAGIFFISSSKTKWIHFYLAILMGIIATYSFANGLLYWALALLILLAIKHQNKKNKIVKLIIWIAASAIIICTYMYQYQKPTRHPSLTFLADHFLEFIKYILLYLGSPVWSYHTSGAILAALFGLITLALLTVALIKSKQMKINDITPYVALSIYAIASAFITAVARTGFGSRQALTPRYITISNLLWLSNIMLFYFYIETKNLAIKQKIKKITSSKPTEEQLAELYNRIVSHAKRISIITVIIVFVTLNSTFAVTLKMKEMQKFLMPTRDALLFSEFGSKENVRLLTRLTDKTKEERNRRIAILKKYKLSVFRDTQNLK